MSISELFGDEVDEKIKLLYIETVSSNVSKNPRDVVVNGLKAVLAELEIKKPNPFYLKTKPFLKNNRMGTRI